jgi:solute carrier family 25 S-adenosylmethionine transporter 26
MSSSNQQGNLKQFLLAGACAGTAVDTALFPLGKLQKKKRVLDS